MPGMASAGYLPGMPGLDDKPEGIHSWAFWNRRLKHYLPGPPTVLYLYDG